MLSVAEHVERTDERSFLRGKGIDQVGSEEPVTSDYQDVRHS